MRRCRWSSPLFPYTTLFRSDDAVAVVVVEANRRVLPDEVVGRAPDDLEHARVRVRDGAVERGERDADRRRFREPTEVRDRKSTRLNPVTVPSRMPSSAGKKT